MSFRTRIFGPGADEPLLPIKRPKGAKFDTLGSVIVSRAETRRGNARGGDRHRLTSEQAILRHGDHEYIIHLVNLSGGGAMIQGEFDLMLWDQVGLVLGEGGELECAVRWIKGDQAGLEFAHETRIDCDDEQHDELLRAVIRKSFPDLEIALEYPKRRADDDPLVDPESVVRRRADRHPLVWNGVIYYDEFHDYEAEPVRLRNISVTGALVQSGNPLPEGAHVYLDMRAAGRHAATVKWTRGDQSGIEFAEPFDIHQLAYAAPELTSAENSSPAEFGTQEPWAPGWKRSTLNQLARDLGA
ncbi:MAG TPA: PilZ domain-containing protein [Sphingomicrobium sp.]|nr:PilZ domain-containing protein [Sphingomicrobium sp.]